MMEWSIQSGYFNEFPFKNYYIIYCLMMDQSGISIDDDEQAYLKILMDEVSGGKTL